MFKVKGLATPGEVAVSRNTSTQTFNRADSIGVACSITVSSPAVKTFADGNVSVGGDQVTVTSHGYKTGLKVQLTTTGTLPGGLSTGTDYYIVLNDGNTLQFATSAANASAGTVVNISSAAGGGTHTITPQSLSASLKLQASVDDGTNWFDLTSTSITATGIYHAAYTRPPYQYIRGRVDIAGGQMTIGDVYISAHDGCD